MAAALGEVLPRRLIGGMSVKRTWSAQAVLLMLCLSGCSGLGSKNSSDGSPSTPDNGSNSGVTVAPANATVRAGAQESFAATMSTAVTTSSTGGTTSTGSTGISTSS